MTPGIVPKILPVHILAGGLALVFGYVALAAAKGGTLHRGIVGVSTPQVSGATK